MRPQPRPLIRLAVVVFSAIVATSSASAQPSQGATLARFVEAIREKAKALESTAGMRLAFRNFTTAHGLSSESVSYSDFAVVRLLFEGTRDAGFWNLHWTITDLPPESDNIWRQWESARRPTVSVPTASAECDELSALFAFLARRAGVRGVGLLWPTSNHTVAAWVLRPKSGSAVRVVVPTTQIFLDETDLFGTRKFDPWRQRNIYEYTRRDVSDTFVIPQPLLQFFLTQADKYGGATDDTLQRLRYLREGIFQGRLSREQAASAALARLAASGPGRKDRPADAAALRHFARDMRPETSR